MPEKSKNIHGWDFCHPPQTIFPKDWDNIWFAAGRWLLVLVLVTTNSTSGGGEVRYVVIGWQSLEQEGMRENLKWNPHSEKQRVLRKEGLREKVDRSTRKNPKMKPSPLRETFPCGHKLVISQSQRDQRDEKDTTFYQSHETLLFQD